jgi:predicted lipid-binding transport protein (Tim44 family)
MRIEMKTVNRTLGIALALAFCLNSTLANTPSATTDSEPEEQVAAAVAAPGADAAAAPAAPAAQSTAEPATTTSTAAATPRFGPGMQIPVDGTSLDAFEKSLAGIKDKTTTPEYTTLTNAIDYLMVYYLEAKRDRAKLAGYLNGKTGEQIVDMVAWRK